MRQALAEGLAAAQGAATDLDTADALGWGKGSIKNVRNRANTLSLELFSAAAWHTGGAFLTPFLALHGMVARQLAVTATADVAKVRVVADALCHVAEGAADGAITDDELLAAADTLDAAGRVMDELLGRLVAAKARRSRAAAEG